MDMEIFSEMGLTKGEIKVYTALLGLGKTTTLPIIRESRVSRSKVYEILDRLAHKGLVSQIVEERVMHFEAINPKRLMEIFTEKEESIRKQKHELEKHLPELESKYLSKKESQEITVYRGYNGLRYIFNHILDILKEGDEYIVFSAIEPPMSFFKSFMHQWTLKRAKKGIRSKIIINAAMSRQIIESLKGYGKTEIRTIFPEFDTPAVFNLFANKTAIILWSKDPICILIESTEVTSTFRKYFEFLWNIAKKLD